MEILGYIGCIAFAIVLVPQVIQVHRTKDASGLSTSFLCLNYIGQLFSLAYVIGNDIDKGTFQTPLYLNYLIGFTLNSILFYYKMCAKK